MNIILGILFIVGAFFVACLIAGITFAFVDDQIFNGRLSDCATKWMDKKIGGKGDE